MPKIFFRKVGHGYILVSQVSWPNNICDSKDIFKKILPCVLIVIITSQHLKAVINNARIDNLVIDWGDSVLSEFILLYLKL